MQSQYDTYKSCLIQELGKGAWAMDGKMIDVPVVGKAKGIVAKAELCGMDVSGLQEKFKDEEPQ